MTELSPHAFCRALLREVMIEVRRKVAPAEIKAAWPWRSSLRRAADFHGPGGFYWHGAACCLWHARAKGWQAYLQNHAEE